MTDTRLYLAPLAGITDSTYRRLCYENGADAAVTEMVSAKALHFMNENTCDLLRTYPEEHPLIVQLFGSDPQILAEQAARVEREYDFDGIDLNFGCPAPKIVKNHEGSFLLTQPEKIEEIVRAITDVVHLPVSAKIRKGFYKDENCAVEAALAAEQGGASMITVHGRTTAQMYSGKADWSVIREVKEALHIPVIGNGDVVDGPSAERMLEETGCDGIMIGRASRGDPWIFDRIHAYLRGEDDRTPIQAQERIQMAIRHAEMIVADKGEYTGILQMRSHVIYYIKGFKGSTRMRARLQSITSLEELKDLLSAYLADLQAEKD